MFKVMAQFCITHPLGSINSKPAYFSGQLSGIFPLLLPHGGALPEGRQPGNGALSETTLQHVEIFAQLFPLANER